MVGRKFNIRLEFLNTLIACPRTCFVFELGSLQRRDDLKLVWSLRFFFGVWIIRLFYLSTTSFKYSNCTNKIALVCIGSIPFLKTIIIVQLVSHVLAFKISKVISVYGSTKDSNTGTVKALLDCWQTILRPWFTIYYGNSKEFQNAICIHNRIQAKPLLMKPFLGLRITFFISI